MCKEFNVNGLPTWLVEALHSEFGVYHLTELFILHSEEKTMEKYYELLCKGLIEKTKALSEQMLKQKLLEINPKIKFKVDSFEGEVE